MSITDEAARRSGPRPAWSRRSLLLLAALCAGRADGQAAARLGVSSPASSPDAATAQGLLLQATLDDLPPDPRSVFLERWTYRPRSGPVVEAHLSGPMVILVLSGRLTATVDRPAQALRGLGADRVEPTRAGAAIVVSPGDGLVIPSGAQSTTSNDEASPAVAIVIWMEPWFVDQSPHYPPPTKVTREHLQDNDRSIAPGPARLALRRMTLAPGEATMPPPLGVLEIVAAESKYLGWLAPRLDGSFTNGEPQPLGILLLTLTPSGAATPTA